MGSVSRIYQLLCPLVGIVVSWLFPPTGWAQVIPDGTTATPNPGSCVPLCTITGGTVVNRNLFHSFEQFSIPTNGEAHFANGANIENIISRVTGGSSSQIAGLIRANGSANLFLLNPAGILFGPNARLDIGGSFLATTANAIGFGDRGFFSAIDPNSDLTLLNVNPSALLFHQIAAQPITNQSIAGLRVPDGRSLLLIGGPIELGFDSVLAASGGQIELAGVRGEATVGLNLNDNTLSLIIPNDTAREDMTLREAVVSVAGSNSGNIVIAANNLQIVDSALVAGIAPNSGAAASRAGNIQLHTTGTTRIESSSQLLNQVGENAIGDAGDIIISTRSLLVTEGSQLMTSTLGRGNAGTIIINAGDRVTFTGVGSNGFPSRAFSSVGTPLPFSNAIGIGQGGEIRITTGSLVLQDGAELNSGTYGIGSGGDIIIHARDRVVLTGESVSNLSLTQLSSEVGGRGNGRGGDIRIRAGSLVLSNGARLNSSTFGRGRAGNIQLNVSDRILLQGIRQLASRTSSGVFSQVATGGTGQGGTIELQADRLILSDGAELNSSTNGRGAGGQIQLDVGDRMVLTGVGERGIPSRVFSGVEGEGVGRAGNIHIHIRAGLLSLTNGAQLNSRTAGRGDGGNITVNVGDRMVLSSSGDNELLSQTSSILSDVTDSGRGRGGTIDITAATILMSEGAQISAATTGRGDAGDIEVSAVHLSLLHGAQLNSSTSGQGDGGMITVNVSDRMTLRGDLRSDPFSSPTPSGIFSRVESSGEGQGGIININTRSLLLDQGAQISAATEGQGNAGSIELNAEDRIVIDHAELTVAEQIRNSNGQFEAGNLDITAPLIQLHRGQLNATSQLGQGGNINLQTQNLILRRQSQISALSDRRGNDGNIIIDANLLFAVPTENSDILARSNTQFGGQGSNIRITSQGIVGIEFRPQPTPQSSDITATGTVTLITPEIDPSRGLVELPTERVDVSRLVSRGCASGQSTAARELGTFVMTGRGGLSPSPTEPLDGGAVLPNWIGLTIAPEQVSVNAAANVPAPAEPSVIEAQGWVVDAAGEVILTAPAPIVTPQLPTPSHTPCNDSSSGG
jgi:filamentous hemagglutinin family protein